MSSRVKLLSAVAAVVLVATPAFAGKTHKSTALDAYASADYGPTSVVRWDGKYAGQDPDQNIRFQLMRDAFANEN